MEHVLPPAPFSDHPHPAFEHDGHRVHLVTGAPQRCTGCVAANNGLGGEYSPRGER
jgi:hypothetical protein